MQTVCAATWDEQGQHDPAGTLDIPAADVGQVLAELIHIVTDSKRFTHPLSIDDARDLAEQWWHASEVDHVFPDSDATTQFIDWHRQHHLGRKRLLDTLLAAAYYSAGVRSILTTNAKDF